MMRLIEMMKLPQLMTGLLAGFELQRLTQTAIVGSRWFAQLARLELIIVVVDLGWPQVNCTVVVADCSSCCCTELGAVGWRR